jgi:FkbM family methyltransferase
MRLFSSKKKRENSMGTALERANISWGIRPDFVIDIGAAAGHWSRICAEVWPNAHYSLVEPLEEQREVLEKLCGERGWRYLQAVAGGNTGEIDFAVTSDLDGSGVYEDETFPTRKMPMRPLDSLLPMAGTGLLKLDTHGYEVPIFEGSVELLEQIELIVVEVYGHKISKNCLCFDSLCRYLDERGFRVAAMVDVINRPLDGSFWQADFLFLKCSHPVFKSTKWDS